MAKASIDVNVLGLPAFHAFVERVHEFITEYAWHSRNCAAVDLDGEWHIGNPSCDCGYDEVLATLTAGPEASVPQDQAAGGNETGR